MKKEITVGQVLSIASAVLIALVTHWYTLNNKITRLETQREEDRIRLFDMQLEISKKFDKIDKNLGDLSNDTRLILITLEKKVDRR